MPTIAILKTKLASGTLLLTIDNQIDPTSGTARFKALFPNEHSELFPNQFVNARLLINTLRGTVLVPTAAGAAQPRFDPFVYVVKADKTVEMRTVTQGPTEGDMSSISSGLKPGEVVVTDGVDKLQNGSKVTLSSQSTTQPSGSAATAPAPGRRKRAGRHAARPERPHQDDTANTKPSP